MFVGKVFIFFVAFFGLTVIYVTSEELYSDQYDFIDVDTILATPRQRNLYYKCFAETGPCLTPDAKFFKDHFTEAIVTNCKKCTNRQKVIFDKVTGWYTENEPEKYKAIVAKSLEKARKH